LKLIQQQCLTLKCFMSSKIRKTSALVKTKILLISQRRTKQMTQGTLMKACEIEKGIHSENFLNFPSKTCVVKYLLSTNDSFLRNCNRSKATKTSWTLIKLLRIWNVWDILTKNLSLPSSFSSLKRAMLSLIWAKRKVLCFYSPIFHKKCL